ncbi:hypothetical protein LguiA_009512 [Lonicera macranthoides]
MRMDLECVTVKCQMKTRRLKKGRPRIKDLNNECRQWTWRALGDRFKHHMSSRAPGSPCNRPKDCVHSANDGASEPELFQRALELSPRQSCQSSAVRDGVDDEVEEMVVEFDALWSDGDGGEP